MKKTIAISLFSFVFFITQQCLVKAFEDNTAPEVVSLTMTPTEINTSEQDQTITATVEIRDSGVGFCASTDSNCPSYQQNNSSNLAINLIPLIGTSTQQKTISTWTRISGDDYDGIWQSSITLPRGSKVGVWEVGNYLAVQIHDKLGNYRIYSENNSYADTYGYSHLDSISNATRTISNTAESSSVKIEKEWTLSSSVASVTFPENTTVTKKEGGSFAFYKMVNQDFSLGSLTNSGLESNSDVAGKLKIGIPGLNLSFDKPVTVKINVDSKYNGQTLNIQALGESDNSWANETTCTVSNGQCSFTVNHATYFVASAKTTTSTSGNVQVTTDTSTLAYSISKKAKKRISYTFTNLSLTNKKYVTMRIGGRKVKVVGLRRSGTSSIVTVELKYEKWGRGNYNLAMSYKNKTRTAYKTKKGKTKYRNGWERGNVSQDNILTIN